MSRPERIYPPEAVYDYPDADGRVLLRKYRYKTTDGRGKDFAYKSRKNERTMWDQAASVKHHCKFATPPVDPDTLLFRLPQLLAAKEADVEEIYWAAGEKDALTLVEQGCVATSHHQGEGWFKCTMGQAQHFRGYKGTVVICVDEDGAGAADAVSRHELLGLVGIAPTRLRVVRAAGPWVDGRDITDHFADLAGYGLDDLVDVDLYQLNDFAGTWDGSSGTSVPNPEGKPGPFINVERK
jgi:hypothetical protein